MKITKLSLAAIAAVAMTSGAMADVDMKIGGQAVVYYQTSESGQIDMFEKDGASANAGVQLNANADLGNGFGVGLQGTALSTFGLEDNLVSSTMQGGGGDTANASDYFAVTKAYLTKQIANTTLKMGRQELPKSLSPLAFSESWNVFKNTFDAIVAINTDIPDTTLVGAYVDRSNKHGDLSTFDDLTAVGGAVRPDNGAYMLTVQNKSLEGITPTLSYYSIIRGNETPAQAAVTTTDSAGDTIVVTPAVPYAPGTPHVDAYWIDVQADMNKLANVPVTVALQGGKLSPDLATENDTNTAGIKLSGKAGPANLSAAYTKTTNGVLSVQNVGTGVKTPLYTQMIANQNFIAKENDTVVLKAGMAVGPGNLIAQYGMTTDNGKNGVNAAGEAVANDYDELDVIYKFKALGADMLAAYVMQNTDTKSFAGGTDDANNIIRLWTRYNF